MISVYLPLYAKLSVVRLVCVCVSCLMHLQLNSEAKNLKGFL